MRLCSDSPSRDLGLDDPSFSCGYGGPDDTPSSRLVPPGLRLVHFVNDTSNGRGLVRRRPAGYAESDRRDGPLHGPVGSGADTGVGVVTGSRLGLTPQSTPAGREGPIKYRGGTRSGWRPFPYLWSGDPSKVVVLERRGPQDPFC